MVIGIDVREAAGEPAGKGRVVRELAERLPRAMPDVQFVLFAQRRFPLKTARNVCWKIVGSRALLWHKHVAKQANRDCDVYLATTSYVTPQFLKIPYILIVYDLIAFKYHAAPQRKARAIENLTLGRAVKRARAILTISQATADDLATLYPAAKGKVSVMPLAADSRFRADRKSNELTTIRKKYELRKDFILAAGTIEPRKNLTRLVRAYAALPSALRQRYDLVLAGKKGWQYDSVFNAIAHGGAADTIHHLDYLPDEDLAKLYATATVFCYPSLYEGFGLPVLEAMQSGTAVITSNISSLPEVGDRAVRYVSPLKTAALTAALSDLLRNAAKRRRLQAAGVRQAKQFSWEQTTTIATEALRAA